MKFSAIAVIHAALATQVVRTYAMGPAKLSCQTELFPCMEVVRTETFQCGSGYVQYCLQPKNPLPSSCDKDEFSHMNVYFGGIDAHLYNNIDTDGEAECTGILGTDYVEDETCSIANGKNSCNLIPFFDDIVSSVNSNVGLKCGDTFMGVCVTVPTTTDGASITTHPAVIFAVKDQGGCEDDFNGWKCNGPFENSCSCSGTQAACVYEPITTCAPRCGDGVVDRPQEECDDGNNINNDSCSNTCLRNTGPGCDDPTGGGCNGDPHFKTWRGHHFDFHGECDLVLLHSSTFGAGLGLDVHIRTKMRRDMSYISAAVLRMGMDTLEVESQGVYYLNGVAGAELPAEFSGFAFSHTQPTGKQHVFEVDLGGRERVKLKTYKDFVSVLIEQGQSKNFGDSVGLMGDFGQGRMLARDGKTILNDPNAFGQEWQVLHTEPSLFQTLRLPQHPMECTLPPRMEASQLRRRLLESSSVDELAAEKACAEWGEGKDDCVFDVLTTGDLDMAMAGSY